MFCLNSKVNSLENRQNAYKPQYTCMTALVWGKAQLRGKGLNFSPECGQRRPKAMAVASRMARKRSMAAVPNQRSRPSRAGTEWGRWSKESRSPSGRPRLFPGVRHRLSGLLMRRAALTRVPGWPASRPPPWTPAWPRRCAIPPAVPRQRSRSRNRCPPSCSPCRPLQHNGRCVRRSVQGVR